MLFDLVLFAECAMCDYDVVSANCRKQK